MPSLTQTDLKALRGADRTYVGHFQGSGYIRCIKCAKHSEPFSEERQYAIPVDSTFRIYGSDTRDGSIDAKIAGAFSDAGWRTWETIVGHLRVGDDLRLEWIGDGLANDYILNSDGESLHADSVHLIVRRTAKNGRVKIQDYHVNSSVGPDNSARMIRGINYAPKHKVGAA